MPRLACLTCGRTVWATAPLADLFAEERRCPRCGAALADDRRVLERRSLIRRDSKSAGPPMEGERRVADRRVKSRRREV